MPVNLVDSLPRPTGSGTWSANAHQDWTAYGVSGGWMAAAIASTVLDPDRPDGRLESISVAFLTPPDMGKVELRATPLRTGSRHVHDIELTQGELRAKALTVSVTRPASLASDLSVAPLVSDPEHCPRMADVAPSMVEMQPPIFTTLEMRPATWTTNWPPKLGREPRSCHWVRSGAGTDGSSSAGGADQLLALVAGDTSAWICARAGSDELAAAIPRTTMLTASFTAARGGSWLLVAAEAVQSSGHVTSEVRVFNRDRELMARMTASNAYRPWNPESD